MQKKANKFLTIFLLSALCLTIMANPVFTATADETSAPPGPAMGDKSSRPDLFKTAVEQNIITQEQYEKIQAFLQNKAAEMKLPAANEATTPEPNQEREKPENNADKNINFLSELVSAGLLTQTQADSISALAPAQVPANGQSPVKPAGEGGQPVPANAGGEATAIKVYIDGVEKTFSPAPQVRNGNTLVPMRSFFEALGCQVEWNEATKTVTGKKNDKTIKLVIGNKTAYVDEQQKSLAAEPQLISGSTFIPLRFVGEALGANVTWENGSISISTSSK